MMIGVALTALPLSIEAIIVSRELES